MASAPRIVANREHALKSADPPAPEGKATSSRSARKHGLTDAVPGEAVLAWYRMILADPAVLPKAFEQDPYLRAAANPARTEAELQRVPEAEEEWCRDPQMPDEPGEQELAAIQDGFMHTLVKMASLEKWGRNVAPDVSDLYDRNTTRMDADAFEAHLAALRGYVLKPTFSAFARAEIRRAG